MSTLSPMSTMFDALPGIEVPVGSISKSLAHMWADTAAKGGPAPASDDAKATQVNFVLHFGYNTTAEDAVAQFNTAVAFSRRYPSRVVVLCPLPAESEETEMRAKIYGECHLGKSKGDTRCCEFVMLCYPQSARGHVENQVSVCLSTDLPLYYWAHRFSSSARLNDYQYLLNCSQRVLFDSATAPDDALRFPWPKPELVRDLAYARLLPVRQSIGQFLARYTPATLAGGLREVRLKHQPGLAAEARVLLRWVQARLLACGMDPDGGERFHLEALAEGAESSFDLRFVYEDRRTFHWRGDLTEGHAIFEADFGAGITVLPTTVSLLAPEIALGDAMFF